MDGVRHAQGVVPLVACLAFPIAGCDDTVDGEHYSRSLLDTPVLLTGVVTEVVDRGEQSLGDLKLRSTDAFNATVSFDEDRSVVVLSGCRERCGPGSAEVALLSLPVIGRSDEVLGLELAAVGGQLEVSSILPEDRYSVLSSTPRLVKSTDTLFIFDIEASVQRDDPNGATLRFSLVTRWTVTLPEALHADFRTLDLREDIGMFSPRRSASPKAQRWHLDEPVHFVVKSVPEEHKEAFRAGLEDWNTLGQRVLGRDIVTYEFIQLGHPRESILVTGDVRENVIEWDTRNLASYGGVAASLVDPRTGETFSSSILIQGPRIMDLYRDWFDIAPLSNVEGRERKLLGLRSRHAPKTNALRAAPVLKLGALELEGDEGCGRMEDRVTYFFEDRPTDVSFEDYMFGYFRGMVAHEVGHTLGFAHNFMGSLADDGGDNPSSTTMEYVWRGARYRRTLGAYDSAALRFAYGDEAVPANEVPPYCVDVATPANPTINAECSPWDGQTDPFSYFLNRVRRAVERGVRYEAVGERPLWPVNQLRGPLYLGMYGVLFYATSAPEHAQAWVRFPAPDRPVAPVEIQRYVIDELEAVMCGDWVSDHLELAFSLNRDAGEAGARAWAVMVRDLEAVYSRLELAGVACDPRERLSFEF